MYYIFKKEYILLVYVTNGAYQNNNNIHVKFWLNSSTYCLILYQSVVYLIECFHSLTQYWCNDLIIIYDSSHSFCMYSILGDKHSKFTFEMRMHIYLFEFKDLNFNTNLYLHHLFVSV